MINWMQDEDPVARMRERKASGWLAEFLPEVHQLYGVPQRPEFHPEIDAGIHTELSLEVASKLTSDPAVRLAALLHDLGKGVTPKNQWPRHNGHEEAGVPLVHAVGVRFPELPIEWVGLAADVSQYHLLAHRSFDLQPSTVVNLFTKLGAYDNPDRLIQYCLACTADARGRTGRETMHYPQAELLVESFVAAAKYAEHEPRVHAVREVQLQFKLKFK